jgi:hypothetical protein
MHDSKVMSHRDQDQTIEMIKNKLIWLGIDKFIEDLVCSSESC